MNFCTNIENIYELLIIELSIFGYFLMNSNSQQNYSLCYVDVDC
jgi:hypothetical protein